MQLNITELSVNMAIQNLTTIVMATGEMSDQNIENLDVVNTIFSETASLLSGPRSSLGISSFKEVIQKRKIFYLSHNISDHRKHYHNT